MTGAKTILVKKMLKPHLFSSLLIAKALKSQQAAMRDGSCHHRLRCSSWEQGWRNVIKPWWKKFLTLLLFLGVPLVALTVSTTVFISGTGTHSNMLSCTQCKRLPVVTLIHNYQSTSNSHRGSSSSLSCSLSLSFPHTHGITRIN